MGTAQGALETSLVEWKRTSSAAHRRGLSPLGNFLSGMETPRRGRLASRHGRPLETSLVEWKLLVPQREPQPHQPLGNFLSGMETDKEEERAALGGLPWKLP